MLTKLDTIKSKLPGKITTDVVSRTELNEIFTGITWGSFTDTITERNQYVDGTIYMYNDVMYMVNGTQHIPLLMPSIVC